MFNLIGFSILGLLCFFVLAIIIYTMVCEESEKAAEQKKEMLDNLHSNKQSLSPQEFFDLRKEVPDFTGIYILHNESKDMYYVGQSIKVLGRVNQHFTGHGNGDVYADYKYGDSFKIKCLSLRESGYDSLNALEKDFIERYNARETGYNRTKGNS